MGRFIPHTTLIIVIMIVSLFLGCTNLDRDKDILLFNEMSARITALEHSFNQVTTAEDLVTLEKTINDMNDSFLVHKEHHPLFSEVGSLIIDAMALYTEISFAENDEDASELINDLIILITLIDDEVLINALEGVQERNDTSVWILMRLDYLLWNSLSSNILDVAQSDLSIPPTSPEIGATGV